MLKLNHDEIKEKEKELTQFEGWLPFRLDTFISLPERADYLKSVGLFDKIQKHNAHFKYMLMNSDDPEQLMDDLLVEFVTDNPQFESILQ